MTLEQIMDEIRGNIVTYTSDRIEEEMKLAIKIHKEKQSEWSLGMLEAHCELFGIDPDKVLEAGDYRG